MEINDRLHVLRSHLELTAQDLGKALHMSGTNVTNMEKGHRAITDRTCDDICRIFGVSQQWLTTGEGPMFADIFEGLDVSRESKHMAEAYVNLSPEDQEVVRKLVAFMAEKKKN